MFVAFLLVAGVGFYQLVDWIREDLRPRYLETMEESMVDTATLLASLISEKSQRDGIHTDDLRLAFDHAQKRRFAAQIFEVTKTQVNMRVYVTDRNGIVLFDSNHGNDEGKDYSRWNDVYRTLRGEYGARATRLIRDEAGRPAQLLLGWYRSDRFEFRMRLSRMDDATRVWMDCR